VTLLDAVLSSLSEIDDVIVETKSSENCLSGLNVASSSPVAVKTVHLSGEVEKNSELEAFSLSAKCSQSGLRWSPLLLVFSLLSKAGNWLAKSELCGKA
jgi:hypothetical protein